MELSNPPEADPELKNIIDKLANFVARNGPEFEHMTKQKQKDNPKFSFLFGGENYAYYQYRVTTEQAIIKQKHKQEQQAQQLAAVQQQISSMTIPVLGNQTAPAATLATIATPQMPWTPQPPASQPNNPQTQQMREQIEQQKAACQDQIKQSESNLADHYKNLIQQQQVQINEAIAKAREDHFMSLTVECDITLEELDRMSTAIIESCTKDAISSGKNWIFAHNVSQMHSRLLAEYLHRRIVVTETTFERRLHLIYLINDVLHHCLRKNAEDLRVALENIVVPVFCVSYQSASEEKKEKLLKLRDLWVKNKYFQDKLLEDLKEPNQAMVNYQANLLSQHPDIVQTVSAEVNQKYSSLQKQHQEFCNHLTSQVTSLERRLAAHEQTIAVAQSVVSSAQLPPAASAPTPSLPNFQTPPPGLPSQPPPMPPSSNAPPYHTPQPGFGAPALGFSSQPPPPPPPPNPPSNANTTSSGPGQPPPIPQQFDYAHGANAAPFVQDYGHGAHPPVQSGPPPPGIQLPDFSKPPPGFPPLPGGGPGGPSAGPPGLMSLPPPPGPPPSEADLMPSVPYFDLPAGLMAPLVKLEDSDYKPLVPKDIRLPPPQPPSDRLLAAVEAFYSQPTHDRPRDSEGWEKLGLYEFFRAKTKAKKMKEQSKRERSVSSSSSRSSSSSSQSRSRSRSKSRSKTPQRRRQRSRSVSPLPKPAPRYRSRSRTPPSRYRRRSFSRSSSRSKSRSRSRSRSSSPRRRQRRERSPTPPEYGSQAVFQSSLDTKLGFDNKGHQLLAKMGWGGGGLGAKEQGRVDPVQAAEARDRSDMFKGLGVSMNDPFEQFRKNKAQGFITRMRTRDAAKKSEKGSSSTTSKDSS